MVRRIALSSVAALVAIAVVPALAHGSARFLVGFAERYTAPDGSTYTHHGVDVAMPAGSRVESPLEGSVSFAGRVPGPHGGTVLAVTLVDGDRRLTLMPLDEVSLSAGERVGKGSALGTLAGEGDPSSDQPHLHAGLRSGGVYVDPSALFAEQTAVSPPAASDGAESPSGGAGGTPVPVDTPVAVPVGTGAVAVGVGAGAVSGFARDAADASLGAGEAGAATRPVRPATVGGQLAEGVTIASPANGGSAGSVAQGVVSPGQVVATSGGQARSIAQRLGGTFAEAAGQPMGAAACLVAALGCVVLFTRRALVRRLASEEPMSHRWGSMLRALRAG